MRLEGKERGQALLIVVTVSAILLTAAVTTVRMTRSELIHTGREVAVQKAFHVAEAGLDRGIAQLAIDRAVAGVASYSFATSGPAGEGTYDVTIGPDPLFTEYPRRKLVESVGRIGSYEAKTIRRVSVQPTLPCALVLSQQGVSRLVTNVAVSTPSTPLYQGLIHSNGDVSLSMLAGLAPLGNGTLNAAGNVFVNTVLSLPSPTNQLAAYYGGNYVPQGIHADLAGSPVLGLHFANGPNKHGEQTPVAAREVPLPDWDRIKRDPDTIVVSRDKLPFGTWDTATNTWVWGPGALSFPANKRLTYYVEGNARFDTVSVARQANATIATRGWLSMRRFALASAAAKDPSVQLIGEGDVSIGRQIVSTTPLTFESEANALLDIVNGIDLIGAMAPSTSRIFAYSEKGTVWGKVSGVNVASRGRVSFVARGDSTLALNGTIESTIECAY